MTLTDRQPSSSAASAFPVFLDQSSGRLPGILWLYLFVVTVPIFFHVGPLLLSTLRLMLLVVVAPVYLRLLAGRYGPVVAADILFLLHVLWTVLALAMNNLDQVIQQTGSTGVEFLGGYALGRAFVRSRGDFLALTRVLVFTVLAMLPFALAEAVTGQRLAIEILNSLPSFTTVAPVYYPPRVGFWRVQLAFAHPIHFGLFCSIPFALCLVALRNTWTRPRRLFLGGLVGLTGFLALSSGAFLAILLQVGLILWWKMLAGLRWRWWLLVGLFALAYVIIDLLSNRTPIKVFMSYATFSSETAYWRGLIFDYGIQNVWTHPFLGLGLNDWARPEWMFTASVDNFWLLMAMRYGIPGFIFVALGWALGILYVMARNFEGDSVLTHIRRAWVFTFLGLSFTLVTVHIWTNIYSFVFFMFGAGMWLVSAQPGQGEVAVAEEEEARRVRSVYSRFAPKPKGVGPVAAGMVVAEPFLLEPLPEQLGESTPEDRTGQVGTGAEVEAEKVRGSARYSRRLNLRHRRSSRGQ